MEMANIVFEGISDEGLIFKFKSRGGGFYLNHFEEEKMEISAICGTELNDLVSEIVKFFNSGIKQIVLKFNSVVITLDQTKSPREIISEYDKKIREKWKNNNV